LTKKRENFRPFFGDGTSTNQKKKEIAGGGAEKKIRSPHASSSPGRS
jgi:hypothetical protein